MTINDTQIRELFTRAANRPHADEPHTLYLCTLALSRDPRNRRYGRAQCAQLIAAGH